MENENVSGKKTEETQLSAKKQAKHQFTGGVTELSRKKQLYPHERAKFKTLLLSNPNYFGNLFQTPFKAVLPISGNTAYEELACLGYHPEQEQLEAVVYIYQPSGYGSDICGHGTSEYVRFYLSFDNGVTWADQGLTSFQAYNIPEGTEGAKRLEYAVSLKVNPPSKLCFFDPLIRARAILSWNNPPPPNQPNWTPIWGNVRNSIIQVDPLKWVFIPPFLEAAEIKLPIPLKDVIDQPVALKRRRSMLWSWPRSTKTRVCLYTDLPLRRWRRLCSGTPH